MIIYRGTVTFEKLKELAAKYLEDPLYDPKYNAKAIALIEQEDGNWKGWAQRNGKVVEVREQIPEHALVQLLTHE